MFDLKWNNGNKGCRVHIRVGGGTFQARVA